MGKSNYLVIGISLGLLNDIFMNNIALVYYLA